MTVVRSTDNPRARRWHALVRKAQARRSERRALIEGPHLLAAYLDSGARPEALVVSESGSAKAEIAALVGRSSIAPVRVSDALLRWIADVESPAGIMAEIALPTADARIALARHAVFLDGVQDAGNVGAILRSAAAFGVDTAVLGRGCADPWSPKVLRAGMGGHFALQIAEIGDIATALAEFAGKLVCAVASGGAPPATLDLRGAVGWILGAEGRGVSPSAALHAAMRATVPLAARTESLNVAAAAAVLFYERARQINTGGARS